MMTSDERKALAIKFIDNFSRRDPAVFVDNVTDDFVFEIMGHLPGLEPLRGKDKLVSAFIPMLEGAFPKGFNFKFITAICEGQHVAIQGTSDTTAANGRKYANRYHWYVRFEGDKIAQLREYADTDHIRQTLGD
jgi:ketosteroid isomerase-like protein